MYYQDLMDTSGSTGGILYEGYVRVKQRALERHYTIDGPTKHGYGRLYYIKNEEIDDMLCEIINDDSQSDKCPSSQRSA